LSQQQQQLFSSEEFEYRLCVVLRRRRERRVAVKLAPVQVDGKRVFVVNYVMAFRSASFQPSNVLLFSEQTPRAGASIVRAHVINISCSILLFEIIIQTNQLVPILFLVCLCSVQWLSRTGSPGCKIEHAEMRNWEYLARPEFRGFSIRF